MFAIIRSHFGNAFPISGGDATREAPLIITDRDFYLDVEYKIIDFLFDGLPFIINEQNLRNDGQRYIDQFCFTTLPHEGKNFSMKSELYFDITVGFSGMLVNA